MTISNTHQKQSNDLLDLQSKVDGILTEALASVELATSASQKNGTSPIDVEAIVRVQKFQAALDAEVQSRLQLEQKLEAMQMASREAENNRRILMDELVSEHEEALRYRISFTLPKNNLICEAKNILSIFCYCSYNISG